MDEQAYLARIAALEADLLEAQPELTKRAKRIVELEEQLAAYERRPLQHGTRPETSKLHDRPGPLLVSWDPDSKAMVVSTMSDFFTHGVATPNSLWDLLVEFHDHPQEVAVRETGRKAAGRVFGLVPTKEEQDKWLAQQTKPTGDKIMPSLDDLDLDI